MSSNQKCIGNGKLQFAQSIIYYTQLSVNRQKRVRNICLEYNITLFSNISVGVSRIGYVNAEMKMVISKVIVVIGGVISSIGKGINYHPSVYYHKMSASKLFPWIT